MSRNILKRSVKPHTGSGVGVRSFSGAKRVISKVGCGLVKLF